jgi:hypothetical protein
MFFGWFGRKGGGAVPPQTPPRAEQPDRVYKSGDLIGGEWRVLRTMEGGLGLVYAVCSPSEPTGQFELIA